MDPSDPDQKIQATPRRRLARATDIRPKGADAVGVAPSSVIKAILAQ
ncbi:MAG: hypothetical protein OXC93_01315 [Rhodospirillaceae bacterium]|nr:hypothetical protein [Rhodospirillaceae bacterium]